MKKYIIIAGVPRAGKSTISQIIATRFGYQHISMDSIIAGIEKTFPETGIDTHANVSACDNIAFISSKMAPFIQAMMNSGEYLECDYGVIIDICQILPKDYIEYLDSAICDIYYFLTSDVTPEERFAILKEYDTPKDYTYYSSDDINKEDCVSIVEISNYLKEQCIEYELPYYETARNRQQIINNFIDSLNYKL